MKAMIFAAGVGSRLKPFTDSHPKALLPVGGIPMLGRVLRNMQRAGVADVVVNVHHFASQVVDYLESGSHDGMNIAVSDETDRLLDTGGGLLKGWPLLGTGSEEAVILHNADILTDIDFAAMAKAHERSGADVTLLASPRASSRMLYFDEEGRLNGWRNAGTGEVRPEGFEPDGLTALAFGGVHIVGARVFPMLGEYAALAGPVFSIMPFYLANLGKLDIRAYRPEGDFLWHDVGSPEKHAAAEAALMRRM